MTPYALPADDTGSRNLILQNPNLFGKKLYELMVSGGFHKLLSFLSLRDKEWRRANPLGVLLPDHIHHSTPKESLRGDFFKHICEPIFFYFPDYRLFHIDWQPISGLFGIHRYSPLAAAYLQEQIHILNKAPIIKTGIYQNSTVLSQMIRRWEKCEWDGKMNEVLKQGDFLIWAGKDEPAQAYTRRLLHGGLWEYAEQWRILPSFHVWDVSTPIRLHQYIKILFFLYGYQYLYNRKNQALHKNLFQFEPNRNPCILWSLETEIHQLAQAFHQKYASPINDTGWVLAFT